VYPGRNSVEGGQPGPGVTPAAGGSDVPGAGGSLAGCSAGSSGWADSVAGSAAIGPMGGIGGNASSLGPNYSSCTLSANNCFDAGAGGGGGGGYFGGGGGATGLDKPTGNCGACNGAGSGQGGGAGASFVSNRAMDPVDESLLYGAGNGTVYIVPVIEIDSPAGGVVYSPGQVVKASFACGYDGVTGLGSSNTCTGAVANGSPIDTSPGTHTFTVSGTVYSNGYHGVSASVTYTVKSGSAAAAKLTAATIKHHSATFTFQSAGSVGFQCALVTLAHRAGATAKPRFSSCRSPKTYKSLKKGKYRFEVRPLSSNGPGPIASKTFKIG
jgi:hypothetical protein